MLICMYLRVYFLLHSHSLAEKHLTQNTPQASASYPEYRGVWLCVWGECVKRGTHQFSGIIYLIKQSYHKPCSLEQTSKISESNC